jgi:NDP-sugar pyrophosphorylase family protein
MKAVILAGGKGTRLFPYTTVFPKPLVPLGETPILEIIIRQLRSHGFLEITLAVGHLSELIKSYFKDGRSLGVKISYSKEPYPLGTVGPLNLIRGLDDTFLLMNGDILTTLSFSKLIKHHKANKGIATIAVHKRDLNVDYGVIRLNKNKITDYDEKPTIKYNVSMGIYVFEPRVLKYIPQNKKLDFPDLILKLIRKKENVMGYVSMDDWLDIGRHDDYAQAQEEFNNIRKYLPK